MGLCAGVCVWSQLLLSTLYSDVTLKLYDAFTMPESFTFSWSCCMVWNLTDKADTPRDLQFAHKTLFVLWHHYNNCNLTSAIARHKCRPLGQLVCCRIHICLTLYYVINWCLFTSTCVCWSFLRLLIQYRCKFGWKDVFMYKSVN